MSRKNPKIGTKKLQNFWAGFFLGMEKTKKLQKCNFATLQLWPKNFWPKKFWIFVGFFFESQKFGFQKPYPYFLGAWIPTVFMSETLSLFFGVGIDLNSFYFINPIPIFWGVWISTVFISETLSLFFLGV